VAKEVAKAASSALPAHLQGAVKEKFGNIDQSDLIMPRVGIIQATSKELDAYDNAKKGEFWHNVANESLGKVLRGIPILVRKSYVLWAPRNDDRGMLARSDDALHWNLPAGTEFEVQPKNSPHKVKYTLGETVHERVDGYPALSEFGSSIPGNSDSPPAAALTYAFLWFFPDYAHMSPAVILNTRSSAKRGKDLISKIEMKPVPSYGQMYDIGITQEQGDEGPYYNFSYVGAGYVEDEGLFQMAQGLYNNLKGAEWKANDESDEPPAEKGAGGDVRNREKAQKRGTGKADSEVPF
jgi:hypothetical protein